MLHGGSGKVCWSDSLSSLCGWTLANNKTNTKKNRNHDNNQNSLDSISPSEFVVDEECILQLLQSCRECSRPCAVTKRVEGLKVTVRQTCRHCDSCYEWTNLWGRRRRFLDGRHKTRRDKRTTSPRRTPGWCRVREVTGEWTVVIAVLRRFTFPTKNKTFFPEWEGKDIHLLLLFVKGGLSVSGCLGDKR